MLKCNLKTLIGESLGNNPIRDDFGLDRELDARELVTRQLELYDKVIRNAPPELRNDIIELYTSMLNFVLSSNVRIFYKNKDLHGKYSKLVDEYNMKVLES